MKLRINTKRKHGNIKLFNVFINKTALWKLWRNYFQPVGSE
jgi:hypothetical protein